MHNHDKMKPSEQCKAAGLKSLAELSRITGKSPQTLIRWAEDQPKLFDVVVRGAANQCSVAGVSHLKQVVGRQSLDDGLLFEAKTAPEAYLQIQIRKLHALIEAL